jgi:hypothetical protein
VMSGFLFDLKTLTYRILLLAGSCERSAPPTSATPAFATPRAVTRTSRSGETLGCVR